MGKAKLKVYWDHDGTRKLVVAAPSYKEAARLLHTTPGSIKRCGGLVRDPEALALALGEPGVVWRRVMIGPDNKPGPWERWAK